MLPRRLRRPTIAYVAVTAPLAGLAGLFIEGRDAFLLAWVYTSAVYTTPAMVVAWAAARRTRYQATVWRLWFLGVVALYLNGAGLLLTTVGDLRGRRAPRGRGGRPVRGAVRRRRGSR